MEDLLWKMEDGVGVQILALGFGLYAYSYF